MNGDAREPLAIRLASRLVQVLFLVALLVLWLLATNVWGVSSILLPRPVNVWHQLIDVIRTGAFIPDLRVTLGELAGAFAIATLLGVTLGYFISRSPYFIKVFEPLFAALYAIPIILFLPLYVLIWGLGPASKIALGATISFFPIVLSTIVGFGQVDRTLVTAARSMGANNVQMFRHVLLPAALPVMLAGLRMGFTVALLSVIGSETIASLAGLGHRIVNLAENMEMARMFAYIVFVIAIVAFLNSVLSMLEGYGRWR
ncbi:MAG TPA: ABC transporter permease [Xanthobacteraceae bacterium]|jgi:ABC-type nitrate/sulfonate/bicarbonate transport system permease component|nr:ABC transporter permease [Xanthobacteraceae bacterium]